jgi:copper homeostasis protein
MLEICAFHLEDCYDAVRFGAGRLEVCQRYDLGGITPPQEWVFALRHSVHIPLVAMVRPRGGDFSYTSKEWSQMSQSAEIMKRAGAHELIFGGVTPHMRLDVTRCQAIIQEVGIPCVLHRAFDVLDDPIQGVEDAIRAGFCRILTGYGQDDPALLEEIKRKAAGRIDILPGGGIRSRNVQDYIRMGFQQVHSSAILDNKQRVNGTEVQALLAALHTG